MVFQSFALWPHMTVREHVEFPLNSKRCTMTEDEKRKAVDQAIEAVGLSTMEKRYPGSSQADRNSASPWRAPLSRSRRSF